MMRVALFMLLLATALPGWAFDEMSASADGRGSVVVANARSEVERAEVSLTVRGDFIISLHGDDSLRFRGTWRQVNDNRVDLTVTETPGGPGAGSGVIQVRDGRFRQIQMMAGARNELRADFRVTGDYTDFTAGGASRSETEDEIRAPIISSGVTPVAPKAPTAPVNRDRGAVSVRAKDDLAPPVATVKGKGRFVRSGLPTRDVGGMEIFLREGGRLHLKIFASGFEGVLEGEWRETSNARSGARYQVTIQNGPGGRATGSGVVTTNAKGAPQTVTVSGRSMTERWTYTLSFEAQ